MEKLKRLHFLFYTYNSTTSCLELVICNCETLLSRDFFIIFENIFCFPFVRLFDVRIKRDIRTDRDMSL